MSWEVLIVFGIAVVAYFLPLGSHKPATHPARLLVFAVPILLVVVSQVMWLQSGKGLEETITCYVIQDNSKQCKAEDAKAPEDAPQVSQIPATPAPVDIAAPPSAPAGESHSDLVIKDALIASGQNGKEPVGIADFENAPAQPYLFTIFSHARIGEPITLAVLQGQTRLGYCDYTASVEIGSLVCTPQVTLPPGSYWFQISAGNQLKMRKEFAVR